MDNKEVERISKALGDPYRLKIIEAIQKAPYELQCGGFINMLDLAQSTVSHHIKQLVDANLLTVEKDGITKRYSVNKEVFGAYIQFLSPFKGE